MPMTSVEQIAESAIEVGLLFLTGDKNFKQVDGLRLLEALQGDLEALNEQDTPMSETASEMYDEPIAIMPFQAMTFADLEAADQANKAAENVRQLTRQFQTLFENVMYSDEVDDKLGAIRGLVDELAMLMGETPAEETKRSLDDSGPYNAQEWRPLLENWSIGDRVTIEYSGHSFDRRITGFDRNGNFTLGEFDSESELMGEMPAEEKQPNDATAEQLGELSADGMAVKVARDATEADLSEVEAAIETGRRAPVVVDFQILQPGPGNKRDNRYYPASVAERDIHVFEGVDIFATDHNNKERSERTKVGKVLHCPTRFTESKAPVAQVLIYDPHQAEKTRNRADSGELNTMECSIFGKGRAKKGTVDGKEYSVVEAITEGIYLELVSKAGAGGMALSLAENSTGGAEMTEQDEKTTPAPDENVEEVDIKEGEGEAEREAGETPQLLESVAVDTALAETNLPEFAKTGLRAGQYADADVLKEAIGDAIAEVKKLTGSGQVKDLGESEPPEEQTLTVEEREQHSKDKFNAVMREVGISEV